MNAARVAGRGGVCAFAHREGPHAVARKINSEGLVPRNDDLAHTPGDHAAVRSVRRDKCRQPSLTKGNFAFVDDLRVRIARLVELVVPGHEIGVGDIRRRRDQ